MFIVLVEFFIVVWESFRFRDYEIANVFLR